MKIHIFRSGDNELRNSGVAKCGIRAARPWIVTEEQAARMVGWRGGYTIDDFCGNCSRESRNHLAGIEEGE